MPGGVGEARCSLPPWLVGRAVDEPHATAPELVAPRVDVVGPDRVDSARCGAGTARLQRRDHLVRLRCQEQVDDGGAELEGSRRLVLEDEPQAEHVQIEGACPIKILDEECERTDSLHLVIVARGSRPRRVRASAYA